MAKKKNKNRERRPNIPPQTLLRVRLDRWLDQPVSQDQAQVLAALDETTAGISPRDYLPVLVRTVRESHLSAAQTEWVAGWLNVKERIEEMTKLVEHDGFVDDDDRRMALSLLKRMQVDVTALEAVDRVLFFGAYLGQDDMGSQGTLVVLWYADGRRNQVTGINFLIDYNPPWEGATKDVMVIPKMPPDEAVALYVDRFARELGLKLDKFNATEAKQTVMETLAHNEAEDIRLPKDLIPLKSDFVRRIIGLPNGPETSEFAANFSAADFDRLAVEGRSPEELNQFERTVGRRVRMKDGKELFIMGVDDWDDDTFF